MRGTLDSRCTGNGSLVMQECRTSVLLCLLIIAGLIASAVGCTSSESATLDWTNLKDSNAVVTLVESPSICRHCIVLEPLVSIGDTSGGGFVEWTNWVVRDSVGRYWVGQRGVVKVFDSAGKFVRQVGRPGQGPMEFGRPQPRHVDREGRVHVLDASSFRETVVEPDFGLYAERRLPGFFNEAAALGDGRRYALNMFLPTPEQIGLPLHIAETSDVLHSFGVSSDENTPPVNDFNSRRLLATDSSGRIFSAPYYDYLIEAWSASGRRIATLKGPVLNERSPLPGALSAENPPPNQIWAIHVDDDQLLWVVIGRRKESWLESMKEVVLPNGEVRLQQVDDSPRSLYTDRIDVIDLGRASIIASSEREELITTFVGTGLALEVQYPENGTPQLVIWRMKLVNRNER